MAVKLNLLPEDSVITGVTGKIIKAVRPLNVILLALFLVMTLGVAGFFIISSISLNNLVSGNTSLQNQIQSQSSAQQQIVLLKDRLAKIKTIQGISGATKNLANMDPLMSAVSSGSGVLSEVDVSSTKANANVIFKSTSALTNFIKILSSNKTFATITMGTFSYNPAGGYQVSLSFAGK